MIYVGIDLAERHSAAVALSEGLEVLHEAAIDSGAVVKQEHPWRRFGVYREWTRDLLAEALRLDETPFLIRVAIEEPYPHAVNVAPSYRMQGAVLAELQEPVWGLDEEQVRITKSKPWQDHFGYTKAEFGNSKAWAKLMVEGFGYEPGLLLPAKSKAKQREDLSDAYLLARWLKETS